MVDIENILNNNNELNSIVELNPIAELNIVLIGEEGVGKSSIVNTIIKNANAPISHTHTKTWKLTKYSIVINNFILNLYDTPGIEGKYLDDIISKELLNLNFDLIICCLDGTRIRPQGMVKKTINFVNEYIKNKPVLFAITKKNISTKEKIREIKSSIRENANPIYHSFGMLSIGNHIPFNASYKFWKEIISIIPKYKEIIMENLMNYKKHESEIIDDVLDYITINYKDIKEIKEKIKTKTYKIKNMKLFFGILAYLYIILCSLIVLGDIACDYIDIMRFIMIVYLTILLIFKLIIYLYSTNYFGMFPVELEDTEILNMKFTGTINFISRDKYYTCISGLLSIDGSNYEINTSNKSNCFFELFNYRYFNNYSAIIGIDNEV